MKINQTMVISLVIGIVVGGLAIGILDAKRPKPLFSHAFEEGMVLDNGGGNSSNCQKLESLITTAVITSGGNGGTKAVQSAINDWFKAGCSEM